MVTQFGRKDHARRADRRIALVDTMNWFRKKVSKIWVILFSILTFVLGPGFFWEWRKSKVESGRLDIERARASLEIREKMTSLLLEIIELKIDSPEGMRKLEDFNAAEQNLARIEGRPPVIYSFKPLRRA